MFSKEELSWIACALEAIKGEQEDWKEEKEQLGLDTTQDVADIVTLGMLLKKVQSLA